jgi:hypothetical protein
MAVDFTMGQKEKVENHSSFTLKMDAVSSLETSINIFETALCYIPSSYLSL